MAEIESNWQGVPLVCPTCRLPAKSWPLERNLRCSNPDCGYQYPWVAPGVPLVVTPPFFEQVRVRDACGPLPGTGGLERWLGTFPPDSPGFNAVSRSAIFLKALADADRESFYRDLCDGLLKTADRFANVLDLGCGVGNLAIEIGSRVAGRVTAVDMDASQLRWGARAITTHQFEAPTRMNASRFDSVSMSLDLRRIRAEIGFICANLHDPPFERESFDLVTLVNVLDAVSDPIVALRQAVALVQPGGHILFASPDSWNIGTTPIHRWLATSEAGWDRVFTKVGLETVARIDDLEWRLRDTPRLHHLYRVHARLLRKAGS